MRNIVWVALGMMLTACASEPAVELTVKERLREAPSFEIDAAESSVELEISRRRGDHTARGTLELPITVGMVDATIDEADRLVIEQLTVTFAPIALPADIHPGDASLVGVRLRLAAPLRCTDTTWFGDQDAAWCSTMAELILDWTLGIDGETWPLGSVTLPPVAVRVAVEADRDRLALDLVFVPDGLLWSWLGVVEFRDLRMSVRAYAH